MEKEKGMVEKTRGKLKGAKETVIKGVKPHFWKEVILTLNTKSYTELSSRSIRKGFMYILALLFASFIIMCIISIPNIIHLPGYIESELSRFDKLNITIDSEMNSPVKLMRDDPQIVIDTTGKTTELGDEKILITEDNIFYRPYGLAKTYNLSEFKDLTTKREEVSRLLTFGAILLMPTILITSYVMFFIKYAITIFIASLLLFLIARIAKKDIGIKRSINTALYAATPMVLIEVVFIPFNSKYLVPLFQVMGMNVYLITLIIYILLVAFSSYFAAKHKKGDKIEWGF
jgi:hypothetical protein